MPSNSNWENHIIEAVVSLYIRNMKMHFEHEFSAICISEAGSRNNGRKIKSCSISYSMSHFKYAQSRMQRC